MSELLILWVKSLWLANLVFCLCGKILHPEGKPQCSPTKAGRDDKAFPSLTSALEFSSKMKSIKSDQMPNHLHENEQVKPCFCSNTVFVPGTKMYWNMFLKVISLLNFLGFFTPQIQTMNYEILSCLWVACGYVSHQSKLEVIRIFEFCVLVLNFLDFWFFWGNKWNILILLYTCWDSTGLAPFCCDKGHTTDPQHLLLIHTGLCLSFQLAT